MPPRIFKRPSRTGNISSPNHVVRPAARVGAGPAVFYGPPSVLAASVLEIATLVDAKLTMLDPVAAPEEPPEFPSGTSLVLVAAGEDFRPDWVTCPHVTVGHGDASAEIVLPRQAHHLVQVLAGPLHHSVRSGAVARAGQHLHRRRKVMIVAGWHGGAGCTIATEELARAGGAIAVDASNHPPSNLPGQDELHWGMIDASDPPLPADLLRGLTKTAGLRYLRAGMGEAVAVTDPRLELVLGSAPTHMVVDVGVWQPQVEMLATKLLGRGLDPRLVLVGSQARAETLRLAWVLSASSGICVPEIVLVVGRETNELQLVCDNWEVELRAFPRGRQAKKTREWQALWKKILGE